MHWFLSYHFARFLTILGPFPSVQSFSGFTPELWLELIIAYSYHFGSQFVINWFLFA